MLSLKREVLLYAAISAAVLLVSMAATLLPLV